ncbi:hypothetical protein [Nocardioides daphniae]|uniref:DUF1232 domain-containing protein n=1 Tax=Nocardioides daphniae TaxID=402297 RepID=A0ABQ1QA74_9ACTN|nr:hypothetical protein [Nocardioides daphniae]GGD20820.1 hypothetical protein GCM10007231_19950 [Nocardioides daphniae]
MVPDGLPGGLVDDAAVIIFVAKTVREELKKFRAWEATIGGGPVAEEPDFD